MSATPFVHRSRKMTCGCVMSCPFVWSVSLYSQGAHVYTMPLFNLWYLIRKWHVLYVTNGMVAHGRKAVKIMRPYDLCVAAWRVSPMIVWRHFVSFRALWRAHARHWLCPRLIPLGAVSSHRKTSGLNPARWAPPFSARASGRPIRAAHGRVGNTVACER